MTTVSPSPTPKLGRFVPLAVLLAMAAHVLAFGVFLFQSPSEGGGGGGQVLGRLSVSLGGLGAAGSPEKAEMEPVMETPVVPPAPRVEQQQPRVVDLQVQKARVVQATPILGQPAKAPLINELVEQILDTSLMNGDMGDGNPVGATHAGALTLGDGVISEAAGIGMVDAAAEGRRDAYLSMIRARIETNRTYPSMARRRRDEGVVVIKIAIDGQGKLGQALITTGSGSFHLDRAATRMVEKSAPFPPPPAVLFTATIPIVFELR